MLPQNSVATRYKDTHIDVVTGADPESITVTLTVKNVDRKRPSCGDRSSLTPGKSRKRNADVVNEDPLLIQTNEKHFEQRRVENNDPVEGGVAYTIPDLVVTKKQNNIPETAIQSHQEGPDEDMDLDEDHESTAASSFGPSTGVNGPDVTREGDELDPELRQRSKEVLVKIAIIAEEPAIPVDEATALTKSSKPPPGHNPLKPSLVIPSSNQQTRQGRVTTATSIMATEAIVTVTDATTAVESLDITRCLRLNLESNHHRRLRFCLQSNYGR